ncbi:lipid droplet-regulating VLDL assembly factor AUP1 [Latimeria chalumnae]|uniref:Lipid droplet-regulating VLDL assembly factor AUP1 n=1 Tax=Latimeria chalumnae TaxID=7897 RepID=H3AR97_LATCH|nr:PREDICTED: ancient ubiquitous protein 1 isoform X1 [Latimeria chalumnae]|eukprot:XP_006004795.1 PREDICTED: ancient ubiquitous protein 1 isoform X1 [Latimeria chalumnae]
METPGIERLFHFHRLPKDGFLLLLLLLYTPVGLCLLLLRIFIGVHVFLVSCVLPDSVIRRFIVRVMCSVLGMCVKQNDPRLRDRSVRVYICNHVTQFDHNLLSLLTSCNTPVLNGSLGFVSWARGFMELGAITSRAALTESLKQYCSLEDSLPLLLFPEEETTNGKIGLLKFSTWPFSIADSLQPIALFVRRPFIPMCVAGSSWISELLWTFFLPFTVYQVRWLQTVCKQSGESGEQFSSRVQELLAMELNVVSTPYTSVDKAECIKRMGHVQPHVTTATANSQSSGTRPRTPASGTAGERLISQGGRIPRMARQVKEVLPHVPLVIIIKDLEKTSCVDTTITNLLEGRVPFVAEDESAVPSTSHSSAKACAAAAAATTWPVANSFGKSASDRHMSLQERKEALYEFARRRYLEKHGGEIQ